MQENPEPKEKEKADEEISDFQSGHDTKTGNEAYKDWENKKESENEPETHSFRPVKKRLTKSKSNRMLFGVCGGLGEYFGIDPTLVRLGFVLFTLLDGAGIIIYIILAIIMPQEDGTETRSEENVTNDLSSMPEEDPRPGSGIRERSDRNRFLGAILLIAGIYLLLERAGVFRTFWWLSEFFLPAALVLGGVWLLFRK